MTFPKHEDLALDDANYREEVRWRLFIDESGGRMHAAEGKNVLISMGEYWTVLSAADFRAMAERILRQL